MEFSDLVSRTCGIRPRKSDLLLIISSFNSPQLVKRHLSLLSRQSCQEFNVLLVLGVPFDDSALEAYIRRSRFRFGVVLAKENDRRGCSGGFFTGQKYALEQGYKYAIMADDDCMPVDRLLVEALYKNRAKGYVRPTTRFVIAGYRKQGFPAGPSQYTLFSTALFRKIGLYYLPLFHGADDGEYMERLGSEGFHIKNYTEHPYIAGMRLFSMLDRTWLFTIQSLMIMRGARSVLYTLLQFCLLSSIALFFLPPYGARLFAASNRLLLTYTYGRRAHERMKSGYEKFVFAKSALPKGFSRINEKDASYIDSPIASRLSDALAAALRFFRKSAVVENTFSLFKAFFMAATARKLFVRLDDGRLLLLADHPSAAAHAARLSLFAIFLPAYCLLFIPLFLLVKLARQPRTYGYGLG